MVSSEMVPLAKTGGLADVTGALANELVWGGENEVIVFLPYYAQIKEKPEKEITKGEVIVGTEKEAYSIFSLNRPAGARVFLVGHATYFNREGFYGTPAGDYADNDQRFIFFQKAVLASLKKIKFKPDIIHSHDWQSALIPVYLRTFYRGDPFFSRTKVVFTVHNLAYQGLFSRERFPLTSLDWTLFNLHALEFYGQANFLKGGLVFSDAITTVSVRYSQEIQTKEFGCGLEGVLKERAEVLYGIMNGLDYQLWNPEKDNLLKFNYTRPNLEEKWKNKELLQKENGLVSDRRTPLIGMVTRLADQKGLDITSQIMEEIFSQEAQMIILGTGDERYHRLLTDMAGRFKGKLSLHLKFDNTLAHRIYAGSDIFLMPSQYEPCGLGQLISLRYGTIPLVREVGGLADSVLDFTLDKEKGNGFTFREYRASVLLEKIKEALDLFKTKPGTWKKLMERGMAQDFSWKNSTAKYLELYRQLLKAK